MSVIAVKSSGELTGLGAYGSGGVVIFFHAPWSEPCKLLLPVFQQLAKQYDPTHPSIKFVSVEAEEVGDVSERFAIDAVPAFVFLKDSKVIDTAKGTAPAELTKRVASFVQAHFVAASASSQAPVAAGNSTLNKKLADLIGSHKVMAFIKGTPDQPQCGFSNKFCAILKKNKVEFGSFDILSDPVVRQGLKDYSNWPTYPQLYVNSKLIGGFDIVKELDEEGELVPTINSS